LIIIKKAETENVPALIKIDLITPRLI